MEKAQRATQAVEKVRAVIVIQRKVLKTWREILTIEYLEVISGKIADNATYAVFRLSKPC